MRRKALSAFLSAGLLSAITPAAATDTAPAYWLNFAIGYYDVFDEQDGFDLRAEFRPNSTVFIDNLKPWAGLELTSQGSIWAGIGLLYDRNFKENWYFTPSLGVGFYTDGGSDKDLDYPVQFRSQLEIDYELESQHRIGLSLSHMSNAGLGDHNPGTEVISLNWSYPF
ncbi:MAG TPA: acyloxyacyl hydrolase [Alphaproteobacteria bacterium]|nr:acyloxyacyl hydrolase [Alphaproteobacteria bacterium]USO06116.1 MAG: acyloxyacyl hydrolase [Rhodospirillales bacterium]HOO82059.1 acyloxyacyl hydrolase [Alphaproteobacteria bacterium]